MSSSVRGISGGGWTKQTRFQQPSSQKTPGPDYDLPTSFSEHIQGHIYKKAESGKPADPHGIPHPSKDRTAWMIGIVKSDLAYYNNIAGNLGPAGYKQDVAPICKQNPRMVFPKNQRFASHTKQFISKEHNDVNLCTAGPGPKYQPKLNNLDLTEELPPKFSFRSKGVSDRSAFLNQMVKGGYIYQARPATSAHAANVGPANYSPNSKASQSQAPRPMWTKADRFNNQDKQFISHKHTRAKIGLNSPGPVYNPTNLDLASQKKKTATSTPAGKWCP